MSKKQTVYYKSESDEFEGKGINPITIDENYKYLHNNFFWNLISFVLYRVLATPFAFLYMKIKFRLRFENKEVLKRYKNKGYFMYANHTQVIGDAFIPTLANFPKKVYVVVHPNNVSIPFWGNIIKFLGPLPIPSNIGSGKNFVGTITSLTKGNNVIMIYPEAHVWSYYTKIRNFDASTFKYPVNEDVPVFAMTITYKNRNCTRKAEAVNGKAKKKRIYPPKIVAYIDGPFFPKEGLSNKEKREDLKKQVFDMMNERAKNNDIEFIEYIKVGEDGD